jgi:hypothetical protein
MSMLTHSVTPMHGIEWCRCVEVKEWAEGSSDPKSMQELTASVLQGRREERRAKDTLSDLVLVWLKKLMWRAPCGRNVPHTHDPAHGTLYLRGQEAQEVVDEVERELCGDVARLVERKRHEPDQS